MNKDIDKLINDLKGIMPSFLDSTQPQDRETYQYIYYLINFMKVLATNKIIPVLGIEGSVDQFIEQLNCMIDASRDEVIKDAYEYIVEYYERISEYLVQIEEYEMCANFRNFIDEFNSRTK